MKNALIYLLVAITYTKVSFGQPLNVNVPVGADTIIYIADKYYYDPVFCKYGVSNCVYDRAGEVAYSPFYVDSDRVHVRVENDSLVKGHIAFFYHLFQPTRCPGMSCNLGDYVAEQVYINVAGYYDDKINIMTYKLSTTSQMNKQSDTIKFAYDTSKNKYTSDSASGWVEIFNNKNTNVTFTDWALLFDSSKSISFELEQDSKQVNNVKVDSDNVVKNIFFNFTTSLLPSMTWRSFQGAVQCHAHFGVKDSVCLIPLTFVFEAMPKSGVPLSDNKSSSIDIYPNPTSGTTHAYCKSKTTSILHLHIFNELGKDIMTVYDGMLPEGKRDFSFKLPQGMYYVRMETAEGVVTKKVVVN